MKLLAVVLLVALVAFTSARMPYFRKSKLAARATRESYLSDQRSSIESGWYAEGFSTVMQQIITKKPAKLTLKPERWSSDADRKRLIIAVGSEKGLIGTVSWEFMDAMAEMMRGAGYTGTGTITGMAGYGFGGQMFYFRNN
jgi:hypothetical protein